VLHGLEPSIDGGTVVVRAHIQGARLVLEVHDNGRGLNAPARHSSGARSAGNGVGLQNIRSRLRSRWGDAARLELQAGEAGTRAIMTLPLDASVPGAPT